MKKITYFLLLFLAVSSCQYDEKPYGFTREFDGGTFITPDGKVKYISGTKDSLILVTDIYAEVQENITYVKKNSDGILTDSILIFGHVYSLSPNAVVCGYDSVSKIDLLARLEQNSEFTFNGSSEPESFMTEDDLFAGMEFSNSFGLQYEKDYYVRSFVVTGRFVGGNPEYKDIAYNQSELVVRTSDPNDLWVGHEMPEAPADFDDDTYWGSTSFNYNGYVFVAQGHNEGFFDNSIVFHRYDPVNKIWETPYISHNIAADFTNAVCFQINDVPMGGNINRDCVYIGIGTKESNDANFDFYRLDLEANTGEPFGEWGSWVKITGGFGDPFPGFNVRNAIAFSLNGIGYVGLGELDDGGGHASHDFFKFDPSDTKVYQFGKWTKIHGETVDLNPFPGGKRTEAICFTIGDNVYVGFGKDEYGNYVNDFRVGRQITGDKLAWYSKASFPHDSLARCEAVGFALGEIGYVGLGKNSDGEALRDFWRYNPFTNEWLRRADFGLIDGLPIENVGLPRFETVGVGVKYGNDQYRGYVGTGWAGIATEAHYYNDFWEYRP